MNKPPYLNWIYGFSISLFLGWVITGLVLLCHQYYILKKFDDKRIPKEISGQDFPSVVGFIERSFFTLAVSYDIGGTAIAMIAWIALKISNTWPWPKGDNAEVDKLDKIRRLSFSSMLASLVSMGFALVGGLICKEKILTSDNTRSLLLLITIILSILYVIFIVVRKLKNKNN